MLRTFTLIVFAHPYCARNSQRNVTPRHASSARVEKTVYAHIGLVAVALTSLAIYFLKWSVTPHFFSVDHFLFHFPIDYEKLNKKSMWKGKKFPVFLCTRRQILAFVRLLGE